MADILLEELPATTRERRGVDALVLRRAQQLVTKPTPSPRREDRPLHEVTPPAPRKTLWLTAAC